MQSSERVHATLLPSCAAVAILALICVWYPAFLHAQEGIAVKVEPSTVEMQVDPGQVLEGVLSVTNENGGMQTYSFGTRGITGMDDSGRPVFAQANEEDVLSAAAWVTPLVDTVTLDVGQTGEVPYRITVPSNISPGSYFAALFVTRAADDTSENGAGVGFNVASLLSLRVRGDAVEDVTFTEFFTNKLMYVEPLVDFTIRLENTGTVHERPRGFIEIRDMLGREAGRVEVNKTLGAIFPREDRVFKESWSSDGFLLGKYYARADIVFGDTDRQTITQATSFWVVPVRELAIAIGVVLGVLLVFVLTIRSYVRRAIARAGVSTTRADRLRSEQSFLVRFVRVIFWLGLLAVLGMGAVILFFA